MSAFSAPGKALIAGGYLVLDPAYNAYVTALSSRMHAVMHEKVAGSSLSSVTVRSPQFDSEWTYNIDVSGAVATFSEVQNRKNPFLYATVKTVLAYVQPTENFNLDITLFSDPGYHTQESTTAKKTASGKHTFLFHGKPIDQVAKTGMGLSAGLVSVVTAALISHFFKKPVDELRNVIHNVAQIAHCDAQGKIGSGFDVAAAVYGSIIYRRFTPETIDHVLGQAASVELNLEIRKIVDSEWQFNHAQCSIPQGIRLLMGDVNGGSETPKLVSKVLAWRKSDPESSKVYGELDLANESFIASLKGLENVEDLTEKTLQPVVDALARIRKGLQKLTAATGAEIEPQEQTDLLDRCAKLPGCLGGVVPGAGGYDAICLLVEEKKLQDLKDATAQDPEFASVTWLDLSEEAQGLQVESPSEYDGLA